ETAARRTETRFHPFNHFAETRGIELDRKALRTRNGRRRDRERFGERILQEIILCVLEPFTRRQNPNVPFNRIGDSGALSGDAQRVSPDAPFLVRKTDAFDFVRSKTLIEMSLRRFSPVS